MSNELLKLFETINNQQRQRVAHPTDDLGWPICDCELCKVKHDRMSATFIDSMLVHGIDLDRTPVPSAASEIDYDGDMGHEWQDTQRDRAQASGRVVDRSIPHVKAPSIVPDGEET